MSTDAQSLEISWLASMRTGHIDKPGEQRLLDAINLAADHDRMTWLTDGGKRIAAVVPAGQAGGEVKTEYGQLMSGGGYHIRWDHPEAERIFPVAEWIKSERHLGGRIYRRRVTVVEDWIEVTKP